MPSWPGRLTLTHVDRLSSCEPLKHCQPLGSCSPVILCSQLISYLASRAVSCAWLLTVDDSGGGSSQIGQKRSRNQIKKADNVTQQWRSKKIKINSWWAYSIWCWCCALIYWISSRLQALKIAPFKNKAEWNVLNYINCGGLSQLENAKL